MLKLVFVLFVSVVSIGCTRHSEATLPTQQLNCSTGGDREEWGTFRNNLNIMLNEAKRAQAQALHVGIKPRAGQLGDVIADIEELLVQANEEKEFDIKKYMQTGPWLIKLMGSVYGFTPMGTEQP